jgi:peptide/nickel transport system ATP-binding protein
MALLEVKDLQTTFDTPGGKVRALSGVSFSVDKGKTLAIVGESGSGKSVTLRSILRILPGNRSKTTGEVWLDGRDLLSLPEKEMRAVRGKQISMIFQEPIAALDPVFTCGEQIIETLTRHQKMTRSEAARRARELVELVQIPAGERRLKAYPHELSGGMRQRMMIAIALSCGPHVLLADEPTTALDVTVQAQVLTLIRDLQEQMGMGVIFVTHDLGVVAEVADDVAVMYAGRVIEFGPVRNVLRSPAHPYTEGLAMATVRRGDDRSRLVPIPGSPPDLLRLPQGCAFAPRCSYVNDECLKAVPDEVWTSPETMSRCVRAVNQAPGAKEKLFARPQRQGTAISAG